MAQEPDGPGNAPPGKSGRRRGWQAMKGRIKRALVHVRARVPPGLRLVLGILLIGGGILGFLPILGFWMIPLGVAVAMLDITPIWRALRSICRQ